MLRRLLIANRGEIVCRIVRTAQRLGITSIAVYSEADAQARHVRLADEAYYLGPAPPAESYLDIAKILSVAARVGADAVHPGYGFLAENADFATACVEAGLTFIGPRAAAIASMGNKAGAKRLMLGAGVPCVPGYQGEDQSEARLFAAANEVGFPVMIKAAEGGGGRGIRLVESAEEFPSALRSATSEALGAFGNATVIIEKAILSPRHIEVQVLADRYGNVVHLGERDCSVQRRHQKLIEEAPSPAVNAELRDRLGATAVAAAKAIDYEGVGTIEYLLDASGRFYFMEMNTRLQVEHPVTEAITGLDLVELQLRIAAGEPLPLSQQDVKFRGHAIEARLCTEDAARSFMPQSGVMQLWEVPSGVRVEHAMASGGSVPPFYDSMIAKLVGYGRTRDDARRRLLVALEDLVALGITTNQTFLASCLRHPEFAAGDATTAFIEQELPVLLHRDPGARRKAVAMAALLLVMSDAGTVAIPAPGTSRLPLSMRFDLDGEIKAATITESGPGAYSIVAGGEKTDVELRECERHRVRLMCDGLMEWVVGVRSGSTYFFRYAGGVYGARDMRFAAVSRSDKGSDGVIRASMSGRVVAVHAAVGDLLAAGSPVFTLEAMKMEHAHVAPRTGRLTTLNAQLNEQVTAHRIMAEISAEPLGTLPNAERTRMRST